MSPKYPNYEERGTDFFGYPIFLGAWVISPESGEGVSIKYGKVIDSKENQIFIKGGNIPRGIWRNSKQVVVYLGTIDEK